MPASDPLQIRRLRWRARRGLLENDLIIARFFNRYADCLNDENIIALNQLLSLTDPDLLEILLGSAPLPDTLACPEVANVLELLHSV
jgi:antitoxin CptB